MKAIRDFFGTYAVIIVVFGILVTLAAVAVYLIDWLHFREASGGIVAIGAGWALTAARDRAKQVGALLADRLQSLLVRPLVRFAWWALGLPGRPVVIVVLAGLAYLLWRAGTAHPWLLAGPALAALGLIGHGWWFRARHDEWRRANQGIAEAPNILRTLAQFLRGRRRTGGPRNLSPASTK